MSIFGQLTAGGSTVAELFAYFWERKLWFMIPLLVLILLLGLLLIFAHSSAASPWLYPL